MYGFVEKKFVEGLAESLRQWDPLSRYEVKAHGHVSGATMWGVVKYIPFPGRCDLGWQCRGFLWFEGKDIERKLQAYRESGDTGHFQMLLATGSLLGPACKGVVE